MTADFYCRLATLLLLVAGFSMLVAVFALLPAYFLALTKVAVVETRLEMVKGYPMSASGEQSLAAVKDLNSKLNLIQNAEQKKFLISDKVIDAVLSDKISGIKISQILYQNDPSVGKKISLTGTASSRAALLLFEQTLQDNPAFQNVNLPISNFVKESDIDFYLTLTPS